jgi:putative phage-type endonuclease
MATITVRDQTHWHDIRSQHIGASEVAALFDMSPFTTLWQLWMEKSGKLPPEDLSGNKSVQAGTFLESGIANWAAHRWDMKIEKVVDYYTADDCPGMGASLDFQTDGGHPVEIKWSAHGDGWEYEGDTITCAPDNYVLQVLHQMACTGAEYGWLIALIRNEPRRMKVPRSEEIISKIKSHVAAFWDSVACGAEPPVDFNKDGDAVVRLLQGDGTLLGLDDDDGLPGGCPAIDPTRDAFAVNLPAGSYAVRVEESGNDAVISRLYRLEVSVLP